MKKLLILFSILFCLKNMQAQNTCATAKQFASNTGFNQEFQTTSVQWFVFDA